ncbi:MAG: hypothetical protein DRJ01_05430 [Bacteroidetes bacterium]|nr:MAG: hypothetical protein DRJ01_05430 [Bacteroidota bacterium]
MNENNFVSVKEYFEKGTFVVPYYQRGFKWSLLKIDGEHTHLEQLLSDLIKAFIDNPDTEYHLQGITVKNKSNKIELVDGQQRTTSLFLILLYAYSAYKEKEKIFEKDEFFKKYLKLDYAIRREVNIWIYSKKNSKKWKLGENIQDIAAFNEAWSQINKKLKDKKEAFFKYILNNVKLICIALNTEPTKVFSMMNKDKATMKKIELVKSHLLSEASRQAFTDLDTKENDANEWQINHLRSHFAREWDSWLKWWNDKENQKLFNNSIPEIDDEPEISRLLNLYCPIKKNKELKIQNLFAKYCELIDDKDQENGNSTIEAVETFEGLRLLQNIIEEWYDDPLIYNYIGMLCRSSIEKKFEVIKILIEKYKSDKNNFKNKLKEVANWSLVGEVKLEDLTSVFKNPNAIIKERADECLQNLSEKYAYFNSSTNVNKQLLRMNIEIDNNLKRKFDFSVYDNKSLEHIHAKSKEEELTFENKDEFEIGELKKNGIFSVHCIGNLVLLDKNDNSAFGPKCFNKKKQKYFEIKDNKNRKSLKLLHTLSKFSKNKWTEVEIKFNYYETLINFCGIYGLESEELKKEYNKLKKEEE